MQKILCTYKDQLSGISSIVHIYIKMAIQKRGTQLV